MKEVKKKFDLQSLLVSTVAKIKEIDRSDKELRYKTQEHKRLAERVIGELYNRNAAKGEKGISINTARAYLTKVRKAIAEHGWKHHNLDATLARIKKNHKFLAPMIRKMENQPLAETKKEVKLARDKLIVADEAFMHALELLDVANVHYTKQVKALIEEYPLWEPELKQIKQKSVLTRRDAKTRIVDMVGEAQSAYNELSALKIDHEIMLHLVKDKFAVDQEQATSARNLNKKKTDTTDIDYPSVVAMSNFLLDVSADWEALAVGVALATGRRAIEIIRTGRFERTGPNTIEFSGQAKKAEINYDDKYDIYSLVPSEKVIDAVERLRQHPRIVTLVSDIEGEKERHYELNEIINNRTSGDLNSFIRAALAMKHKEIYFPMRDWVFKDTRAMYAAICFQAYFTTDPRWDKKDQDIFFKELLGHENFASQAHYKSFKVERIGLKIAPLATEGEAVNRAEALADYDNHPVIAKSKVLTRIHGMLKEYLAEYPDTNVTQREVYRLCGGGFPTIKKYLSIVKDAVDVNGGIYDTLVSHAAQTSATLRNAQLPKAEEEAKPVKAPKPKFNMVQAGEGHWTVGIEFNDDRREFSVTASNRMDAMKAAWDEWEFVTAPEPMMKVVKHGNMWHAVISRKGVIYAETMQQGKKDDAINDVIRQLRRTGK